MLKNLRNKLKDNSGFSLVELIVVIAIMVILIAMLVPQVTGSIDKAKNVSGKGAAKTVFTAATLAVSDATANGTPFASGATITITDATTVGSTAGKEIQTGGTDGTFKSVYVPNMPAGATCSAEITNGAVVKAGYTDPTNGKTYEYKP